jgi:hypothetical protein
MRAGSSLRAGMFAIALMFGAMAGVAMTPEEIEQAMSLENRSKIVYVLEEEKEQDDEAQSISSP